MAITVTAFDNATTVALNVPTIGSFTPSSMVKAVVSGTTTSETITFPNISVISGWIVQARTDSTGADATADLKATVSGNVMTLSDGAATFNLDAAGQTLYIIVWGKPRV